MERNSVLFPEPETPCSTTHSPCWMSRLTLSSTGRTTPPCSCRVNDLLRSMTRIMENTKGSGLQDRGYEKLRVGVLRVVENLIRQTILDDLAPPHDEHTMGQHSGDGQVVG